MKNEIRRLEQFIAGNDTLEFFRTTDKEHPEVQWVVYGIISTNEIFVRAEAGGEAFAKSAPSELLIPPMADRRFGIDVADEQVANMLSMDLWVEYRHAILSAVGKH